MILLRVLPPLPMTRPTSSLWARTFRGTTGRGSWNFLQGGREGGGGQDYYNWRECVVCVCVCVVCIQWNSSVLDSIGTD